MSVPTDDDHDAGAAGGDDPARDAAHWDAVDEAAELLREGEYEAALRELSGVLDGDPRNPYAHYFTGAARFELGEFDAARAAYEQAVRLAPKYLGAQVGLGHALRMLGRHQEALRVGEKALGMAGAGAGAGAGEGGAGDPDAHYLLGLVYSAIGDTTHAIRHLEAVLASNPEVELRHEIDALLETLRGKAKPLEPV